MVSFKILSDINMTSPERVIGEFLYWAVLPFSALQSDIVVPFMLDHTTLPEGEPTPPVYYIDIEKDDPIKVFQAAEKSMDRIVVWKNFIDDKSPLKPFQDYDYVKDTFNMSDSYDFLHDYDNAKITTLPLSEAIVQMKEKEDIYLGFNYHLMANNPHYEKAVKDAFARVGPEMSELTNIDNTIHHGFLYVGDRYSTGMHQAPVADFLIQIQNTKVWRFVHPKYTPYIRGFGGYNNVGMISGYAYLRNDTRIPYVDVATEAGDLIFFPPHWWHEVHNLYEGVFGIACGFRPKRTIKRLPLEVALPFLAGPSLTSHKNMFVMGLLKNIVSKGMSVFSGSAKSGLDHRRTDFQRAKDLIGKYFPGWSWEKWDYADSAFGFSHKYPKEVLFGENCDAE
jgi:hypothetical protein